MAKETPKTDVLGQFGELDASSMDKFTFFLSSTMGASDLVDISGVSVSISIGPLDREWMSLGFRLLLI